MPHALKSCAHSSPSILQELATEKVTVFLAVQILMNKLHADLLYVNHEIILAAAAISVFLLLSCSVVPDENSERFIIKLDSIQVPSIIEKDDTLWIRCHGTVGTNGGYSFAYFEDELELLRLDLTVWGKYGPARAHTDVMVYLEGREYHLVVTRRGQLEIRAHQPDGSVLKRTVLVK